MIRSAVNGVLNSIENISDALIEPFSDPVIRLGVTGLSRAGKTVFITSLVANLMDRGRMTQLRVASTGKIETAYLQPQPDDTIPRFPYEDHLMAITSEAPHWPNGTTRASELRLSMKIQPTGLLAGLSGIKTVHLDIVDYPGEWILDLGLMDKSFAEWSEARLAGIADRPGGQGYLDILSQTDLTAKLDEVTAQTLARQFTAHLQDAQKMGFADCSPGRFLLPGELEGSPVLSFAPLPTPEKAPRRSLYAEFERRYESYKRNIVMPFFRNHFAKIDRQVVLVDVLGAIHAGPRALDDLRHTLADVMAAFNPGRNGVLSQLFHGRRIEKILFAATKADHLHHEQHARLTAITEALLREAKDRAKFAGAATSAMSIAALRTTVEDTITHDGESLNVVRGKLESTGKYAAIYPGELPESPSQLLNAATRGDQVWLDGDYDVMNFLPAELTLRSGEGPPHIRLDKAAEFLIGDKLT